MVRLFFILGISLFISCGKEVKNEAFKISKNENRNQIEIMVLGTFHFYNAQNHDYNDRFNINILSRSKQKELEKLVQALEKFKPTKIALEVNRISGQNTVDSLYRVFIDNPLFLQSDVFEGYQIGFRLAKKLKHNRLYATDATAKWFGADLDWDNFSFDEYLKEKKQYGKSNRYNYETFYIYEDSLKTTSSLLEYFKIINLPEARLKDHQAYLTGTSLTGAGDNYIGADAVARWYRRNLRIFANVYDITDMANEQERILLIYGSGHTHILKQLFNDSPDYKVIEAGDFLN